MRKIIVYTSLILLCIACVKKENSKLCTEEARAGINLTILSAETNTILYDSIRVVIKDGLYSEELMGFKEGKSFSGAFEREGTYEISITHPSYHTLIKSGIKVLRDDCHVITQNLSYKLTHK